MRLLLEFRVRHVEPVPWSVPDIGKNRATGQRFTRRPKKSAPTAGRYSLADWQAAVDAAGRQAAADAGLSLPLTCPIRADYVFVSAQADPPINDSGKTGQSGGSSSLWDCRIELRAKTDRRGLTKNVWVKLGRTPGGSPEPDLTNLVKGTEDALEVALIANDVQVRAASYVAVRGPVPGVRVRLYALDAGDYADPFDD